VINLKKSNTIALLLTKSNVEKGMLLRRNYLKYWHDNGSLPRRHPNYAQDNVIHPSFLGSELKATRKRRGTRALNEGVNLCG